MATVEAHYQDVLSGVYSWMLGGFDVQIAKNRTFFENHHLHPKGSSVAIDLGAGCGFQSIPLAEMGYSVTAIDLDENLLRELKANDATGTVAIERDDMINFDSHVTGPAELIVCMTDTLLHLESKDRVGDLFGRVINHLDDSGRFVITFRDLTNPLDDLDRFIPVRQDASTILTCFLEYESDTVKVHDLVYINTNGQWQLHNSFYRKLRLSPNWVKNQLLQVGFPEVAVDIENGLVTVVAGKAKV
jgi:hypothetical protein